jgi:hypothetical protein
VDKFALLGALESLVVAKFESEKIERQIPLGLMDNQLRIDTLHRQVACHLELHKDSNSAFFLIFFVRLAVRAGRVGTG